MASPTPVVPYYRRRRRSLAGPLVLIIVGVFSLLGTTGVITWPQFGHYFARYWPLLLILWGAVRLAEYYSDKAHGCPTRSIGAGGVIFLIFLIIFGISSKNAENVNWQGLRAEMDVDDDNPFGGIFGQTYTFNASQQQDIPALKGDVTVRVLNDRGAVTMIAWDENKVKVDVEKKLRANDQGEAGKIDQQTQPTISIDGNVITVNANTTGSGPRGIRSDMEVWVPRSVAADISTQRGDITVSGRNANVKVSDSRGDIAIDDITGNVDAEQRRGDVRISKVTGAVSVDGRADETTISEINGPVKLNGEYLNGLNLSKISKQVVFQSSRTTMEIGSLPGDLTMDGGDLRAVNLAGPVKVLTRSKDIHLDDLTGELRIENANGAVEVHSTKLGPIDISNRKGDVQVSVPEKSAFQVDFKTRNGDITSDFSGLKVSTQQNDSVATGAVGSGGPRVQINNEYGNIEIRKAGAPEQESGKD